MPREKDIELSYGYTATNPMYACAICGTAKGGRRLFTTRDGFDDKGPTLCGKCVQRIVYLFINDAMAQTTRRVIVRGEGTRSYSRRLSVANFGVLISTDKRPRYAKVIVK